jgi:hypothetical protein
MTQNRNILVRKILLIDVRGVHVKLHTYLTLPLDGGSCHFTPGERSPSIYWIHVWAPEPVFTAARVMIHYQQGTESWSSNL